MVERKNNKQKTEQSIFCQEGKTDPGSMCVFISGSPYSQLRSKPYA